MESDTRDAHGAMPIRAYAHGQAGDLLRRMAFQAGRAARVKDEEAVHDLRVSIRRLSQCLRVFEQFLPRDRAKRLRRKLSGIMDLASEVRNRDIALKLLRAGGVPAESALASALSQDRGERARLLTAGLKRWSRRESEKKWRARLGL